MGVFSKLVTSLKKTKDNIAMLFSGLSFSELDEEFFEELEYILIGSDFGVGATEQVLSVVRDSAKKDKIKTKQDFLKLLKQTLKDMLPVVDNDMSTPCLITFVGINGVGKTTAIGKLSYHFKKNGLKVLVVAGDTFRAAASEQLTEWATKAGVRIVKYSEGADPGAVVYDGVASAIAKKDDIVLIDTAGRLHTKSNLMMELKKIDKVSGREWQGDKKTYLVIDATTGQNALSQVKTFNDTVKIDGIVLTKLDGTAKGGIVFAIAKEYNIPVIYVGVGEGVDDIEPFDADDFIEGLFE